MNIQYYYEALLTVTPGIPLSLALLAFIIGLVLGSLLLLV